MGLCGILCRARAGDCSDAGRQLLRKALQPCKLIVSRIESARLALLAVPWISSWMMGDEPSTFYLLPVFCHGLTVVWWPTTLFKFVF